jgi:eukaryotic-like serine/threonine-protein kinase
LFIRRLNEAKAIPLPGTEGATNVFFSTDSQWVAFSGGRGGVRKIPVEGGPVVPVALGTLLDWAEDGTILFGTPEGLMRTPAAGGQPVKMTEALQGGVPRILPGGKAALFASRSAGRGTVAIQAVSFADGKPKVLVPGAGSPRYLPTGHLIYVSKGTLFAVPFDPGKLETRGNAVAIVNDVRYNPVAESADISVSRNGILVYHKGGALVSIVSEAPKRAMEWIDAAGKRSPVTAKTGSYSRPRFSPDGSQVALLITEPDSRDEWVYDLRRDSPTRVTFGEPPAISTAAWSPDGRYLFIGSGDGETSGIYLVQADGSSQKPERLLKAEAVVFPGSYSKETKRLAFYGFNEMRIWIPPLAEENGQWKAGKAERFLPRSRFTYLTPEFSPDGRWLAYATDETGQSEVNVRPVSGPNRKWKISTDGGSNPRWWRNELLYHVCQLRRERRHVQRRQAACASG